MLGEADAATNTLCEVAVITPTVRGVWVWARWRRQTTVFEMQRGICFGLGQYLMTVADGAGCGGVAVVITLVTSMCAGRKLKHFCQA